MKTRVSIIIMSQLSDVQECLGNHFAGSWKNLNIKINFAKYLTTKYKDNTVEVDADVEFEEFKKKHPNLA